MLKLICTFFTALLTVCSLHAVEVSSQEHTLAMIKPDAVAKNHVGEIIALYEKNGLHVAALKMTKLSKEDAQKFYAVHKDRPFYDDLTTFMSTGPVVAIVLEGPEAIVKNREIMGATDPQKATAGTIRALFAESVTKNAVHGSDSPEAAVEEISFFFKPAEVYSK
jgi:nucleoside-diphosphate kinase